MGFLDVLEKAGLVALDKNVTPTQPINNPQATVAPTMVYSQVGTPTNNSVGIDQNIVDKLNNLVYKNDTNLVDFVNLKNSMQVVIPDENIMFSAVLAALSAKGITKELLLSSFNTAKGNLETQKTNFNDSLTKTKSEKLGGIEHQIESNKSRITELTNEIVKLQESIQTLTQSKSDIELKLQDNETRFNNSYNFVLSELIQNLNKI